MKWVGEKRCVCSRFLRWLVESTLLVTVIAASTEVYELLAYLWSDVRVTFLTINIGIFYI